MNDIVPHDSLELQYTRLIDLVIDAVDSEHTKRAYSIALLEFLDWHDEHGRPPLVKATVQRYRTHLRERGLAPSTINVRLSALRKFIAEAADNELLDQDRANVLRSVPGVKTEGVRTGNWLTLDQARALLNAPDTTTHKGRRDKAILAVLILAGLRREEAARLTVEHIQQRDGRWVIVDLIGKRGKVRSVPIQDLVKELIDQWTAGGRIVTGPLWRGFRKNDRIDRASSGLSSQGIWRVVETYAGELGLSVAPHDLRRTYAKLAHQGGAPIEQISLNLGHSSIEVTERYLGVQLDLANAPSDYIDI